MSTTWTDASWLGHVVLGGGLLLLATWVCVRLSRQPARQQRLAELGLGAALLLAVLSFGPAWLAIPVPFLQAAPTTTTVAEPAGPLPPDEIALEAGPWEAAPIEEAPLALAPPVAEAPAATPAFSLPSWPQVVVGLYLAGAAWFLVRFARGCWQLARFLRSARPAPASAWDVLEELCPRGPLPRLLVSHRARVPLSCGVFRPTIVLPESLCEAEAGDVLRWSLAHELTHLRRRDALTSLLFGLGAVLFYCLPWYWSLRRRVRLCQEYVADAAAADVSGAAADYAQFLLNWTTAPPLPAGATGVSGNSSDLFRRLTMLLRNPMKVEDRCPRLWSWVSAALLLSLAVCGAGLGLYAAPADDVTKDEKKQDEPKKNDKKEEKKDKKDRPRLDGFPDIDRLLDQLGGGLDDRQRDQLREQLKQARKMMEDLQKQLPQGGAGGNFPGIPNIPNLPNLPGLPGAMPIPNFPQLPNNIFPGQLNRRLARQPEPRLGARIEKPSDTLVDQLDLPRGQGLIIEDLVDDAAAAKAGLKKHDILLELGGKPVPNDVGEFQKMLQDVKPETPVDAVVLRKSRKETVKGLSLPKPKEEARPGLRRFQFPNLPLGGAGRFGGLGGSTSMTRTNDSFTVKNTENNVTVSVTGKIENGAPVVSEVTVKDGEDVKKYESVDKVPEGYRGKVNQMVEMARGNGRLFQLRRN